MIVPHLQFGTYCCCLYCHFSLFVYASVSTSSRGQIVISIHHNEARRVLLLCNYCICIFLTCAGNECHLHMLVETSAISADSHVCSGLLSRVEKQLGVNKRKESAYTWARPLSKWHQIALFFFPSPSLPLYWFYSKLKLHHLTNYFCGNARLQQKQQVGVCEINARYSAYEQSLSLRGSAVFLFASSNFISPSSHQSQESNKDDWLHFITAGFIFQEDLQVHPDNVEKKLK